MSLQWYPGHMTKARRELFELAPSQHLIIEVLDARLPGASRNPLIAELGKSKPRICVLTKSDLADPAVTSAWIQHLEERHVGAKTTPPPAKRSELPPGASQAEIAERRAPSRAAAPTLAIAVSLDRQADTRAQLAAALKRLGLAPEAGKRVRALIAGVPNVGKSSLINTLMQRAVANVADKPAVTKAQQQVVLKSGLVLTDSPGMMWPKIEEERSAMCLAFAGSIPDTAVDYPTMASFGARLLLARYPELLVARFRLEAVPSSPEALIEAIGRRRGALRPGGVVDLHRASEALVKEFRSGALGRISLELP
ncbi:MAG: ribosome biogenesis GTPase YlqF [Kofleriaceae bacterium]